MGTVNLDDPRSIAYNKEISRHTVRWAMVEWMQEKHQTGIWKVGSFFFFLLFYERRVLEAEGDLCTKDVIATHFSIRRHCIREWYVVAWGFFRYQRLRLFRL